MIEIVYTLHADDGELLHEEIQAPLVPRVGELIDIDDRSYQVVDVLWHHYRSGNTSVTVTACELSWHKHINQIVDAWRDQRNNQA